ncbi:MAG: hypothetical protein PHP00_06805 [Thiotrichaceae bacterium]|nr:hypothetical protein [Thiotrichaceae bacterium]
MARQKQIAPTPIAFGEEDGHQLQSTTQLSADFARANQLMGHLQCSIGISKLVNVTTLIALQEIKESKLYKHLALKQPNGEVVTITSWEDFCKSLGRSRESVDMDLRNLNAFGADALEVMQDAGISKNTMNHIRKIPEDERNVIIEQITQDTTNKEELQRNILELIQAQTRLNDEKLKAAEAEKDVLKAKTEEATRALEVKDRVIAQKTAEIQKRDKTVAELEAANAELLGSDNGVDGIDILNNKLADKLSTLVNSVLSVDMMRLRKQIIEIQQANAPEHIQLQCGQVVVQLIAELQSIQVEYQLDVPSIMDTSWMDNIPADVQD